MSISTNPHNVRYGNTYYNAQGVPSYAHDPSKPVYHHHIQISTPEENRKAAEGMRECFRRCCEERRCPCYDCIFESRIGRATGCAITAICCCCSALTIAGVASNNNTVLWGSCGIATGAAMACWAAIWGYCEIRDSGCCAECCGYQRV